jgi:hypothetical protein
MSRDLKIGIVGGLISSAIFIYFLEPILRIFVRLLSTAFGGLSDWFVDAACARAALGAIEDSGLIFLFSIVALVAGIGTGSLAGTFRKKDIPDRPPESPSGSKRALARSMAVVLVCFSLLQTVHLSSIWLSAQLITSFNQHIAALVPAVGEAQTAQWRSQWAQMESKAEHSRIYAEMSAAAKQAKIKLMKNPVYSFTVAP